MTQTRRHARTTSALIVALVSLVAGTGCTSDGPTGVQLSELQRAEVRWQRTGYANAQYRMQQQLHCFCPDAQLTYEVLVRGGVIAHIVDPLTGGDLPTPQFARFRSVEQLFAEIRAGLRSGAVQSVAYDALTGYPAVVSLDPIQDAVDDEVTYRTSRVTPVP